MQTLYVIKSWDYKKGSLSQTFKPNIAYEVPQTVFDAAVKANVVQDGAAPAATAVALSLPEADIKKMKKDELLDFVLSGGSAQADLTLATELETAQGDLKTAQTKLDAAQSDLDSLRASETALIAAWNDGVDADEQADTLADITAGVQLMRQAAKDAA